MKKGTMKLVALVAMATMTAATLTGCGIKETATNTTEQVVTEVTTDETQEVVEEVVEEKETLKGTITMAGSTSMEKLANAVAESLMMENPELTINAEFTGSSAGVEALIAGSVQIGNASRGLKDTEKEAGAVENIVAIDGIAVVVDKNNTVASLSKEQLISIYTGEIKNWKEVGGEDSAIVVVGREAGSGTRGAFEEILKLDDTCAYANELDSTGAVMAKVASTPGAIGYVSLDVVDNTVIAVALDDIEPTADNVKGGSYFLSRPFVMATLGTIEEQQDNVKGLFEYLASEEGKAVIKAVGLITVD